jgi:aminoglycoside phosphotransferase (APT) family kinase protein
MSNIWDPTLVVDEELVRKILKEQFPAIDIKNIHNIGEGFDNTVFNLNNEILLRFPRREVAVSILQIEKNLLPLIKDQIGIQTTVPIIYGSPSKLFPWPFLGYNFIKGKPPTHLSRNERIQMIEPLAKFLKNLHSIPLKSLKKANLPFDTLKRLNISFRKPQLLKYVNQAIQQDLIKSEDKINHYLENINEIQSNTSFVLVHGDLHFKNIIVNDSNQIEGIIDWGDAHIGNPELDLSIVYSLIPSEVRNNFYEIYGEISVKSKQLAKFKAIYTTILLLLFANEQKDIALVSFCHQNLENALSE